jgi:hypothetical protein
MLDQQQEHCTSAVAVLTKAPHKPPKMKASASSKYVRMKYLSTFQTITVVCSAFGLLLLAVP